MAALAGNRLAGATVGLTWDHLLAASGTRRFPARSRAVGRPSCLDRDAFALGFLALGHMHLQQTVLVAGLDLGGVGARRQGYRLVEGAITPLLVAAVALLAFFLFLFLGL